MIRAAIHFLRLLPARLELEHLRWAARQIHPLHSDVPYIAHRIAHLEDRCYG